MMPPAVAAANDSTSTPNRSSRCRTATSPPLMAKANVPRKSIRATKVAVMAWRECARSGHRLGFAHAGKPGRQRDELRVVQVGQLHAAGRPVLACLFDPLLRRDRKSTRLNSSHVKISYAVFCLK